MGVVAAGQPVVAGTAQNRRRRRWRRMLDTRMAVIWGTEIRQRRQTTRLLSNGNGRR